MQRTPAPATDAARGRRDGRVRGIMAVLLTGGFLSLLNETLLNVALTPIMREMGVGASMVQWLSTGYVLVVAIMVPVSAFLVHSFTTRRLFLGAMGLFLLGTAAAALAPSFPLLLVARMLQATGTGLLAPVMIDTALSLYPRERHGYVMGLCTCVILIGPSAGPVLSGLALTVLDWRALFAMLVPLIVICMVAGAVLLGAAIPLTHPHLDIRSVMLSSVGFSCLVYAMSEIGARPVAGIPLVVIGLAALALFARRQLRLRQPMLDVRAFRIPAFLLGAVLVLLVQMVQFSMNVLLPMLFEGALGMSSLASALVLLPAVLVCSLMTIASGRLYDRMGGRVLIPLGAVLMLLGLLGMCLVGESFPVWGIMGVNVAVYLGISLMWSPNQSNAISGLPRRSRADGVAILNTLIQLGSALGTPLLVGVMSSGQASYLAAHGGRGAIGSLYSGFADSMHVAVVVAGLALMAAIAIALVHRRSAETMPVDASTRNR